MVLDQNTIKGPPKNLSRAPFADQKLHDENTDFGLNEPAAPRISPPRKHVWPQMGWACKRRRIVQPWVESTLFPLANRLLRQFHLKAGVLTDDAWIPTLGRVGKSR